MTNASETYLIKCPACHTANRVHASSEGRAGRCGSCHSPLPPLFSRPVELSDRTFGDFAASYPGLLLAEFWAPW